jgi:cellobiose phosphorylase
MRLLGEHVPYPVEAWPEGGQRHLSAESALYCRTVTEGLFGINPTGLNKFTITPTLPNGWNYMKLKNIKAFDRTFDIEIQTDGNTENVIIKMSNGALIKKKWDRKTLLEIVLP